MAAILEMPKYYTQVQSDTRYGKIIPNYARKSIFHEDDVIYDVTGWLQIRPSILLSKRKMNIFRYNRYMSKYIAIKLSVHMYHDIVNIPSWLGIDYVIDDVIRSQNLSTFSIAIALSISKLEHRSKAQNATNTHGYILTYSTYGITYGKKVCCDLKMAAILKTPKY